MTNVIVKQRLVDATDALARVAGSALSDPDALVGVVRVADALQAIAIEMLADAAYREGIMRASGWPVEVLVGVDARRTRWDSRDLLAAADALRSMPRTRAMVADGVVSLSQVRGIERAIRPLRVSQRGQVDELIGRRAPALVTAEPDRLVEEVEDLVVGLREDLLVKREDRLIERSFLAVQQRLDGGGSIYGEADAERFATLTSALDAAAERPDGSDAADVEDDASSRARQRMDALVRICEASLAGGTGDRPRARILAVLDVTGMDRLGICEGARVLANVAGRPLRLSRLATETLLCDADVTPMIFAEGQPIGVGNTASTIPEKLRAAVIARDGCCRFPGCRMPAAWADVHHLRARADGGDARIENLLLFMPTLSPARAPISLEDRAASRRCRQLQSPRQALHHSSPGSATYARMTRARTGLPIPMGSFARAQDQRDHRKRISADSSSPMVRAHVGQYQRASTGVPQAVC